MIRDLVKFNVNNYVWVKLTPVGRTIVQKKHDELRALYPDVFPDHPPVFDREREDGFSQWQLWSLMEMFGEFMHNGTPVPFETSILIEVKEGE